MTDSSTMKPACGDTARHLFRYRQQELDELFASLGNINSSNNSGDLPQGVFRGRLFGIRGISALPRPLFRLLYRVLASFINPWKGKSFSGNEGANIWLSASGAVSFGHYHVAQGEGEDGQPLLTLNYQHPRNPALLRPIRGEARPLGNGVWLARMRWQGRHGLSTLLYFTLENNA